MDTYTPNAVRPLVVSQLQAMKVPEFINGDVNAGSPLPQWVGIGRSYEAAIECKGYDTDSISTMFWGKLFVERLQSAGAVGYISMTEDIYSLDAYLKLFDVDDTTRTVHGTRVTIPLIQIYSPYFATLWSKVADFGCRINKFEATLNPLSDLPRYVFFVTYTWLYL
jgi:hypothetical protein